MNSLTSLLIFAAYFGIQNGNGLKCYQYSCIKSSMGPSAPCPARSEFTCEAPNDRCMVLQMANKMDIPNVGVISSTTDMQNCTVSLACSPSAVAQVCKSSNVTGALVSCDIKCCQGDLCNTGGPMPTALPPTGPTGPSGADLSCYECGPEGADCKNPSKRTCGSDMLLMDRCMTVKATAKNPKTGELLDQELKNCSNSAMCPNLCKYMNMSSGYTKCDATCCVGNLCNGDNKLTTVLPGGTTASQTPTVIASTLVVFSALLIALFKVQ